MVFTKKPDKTNIKKRLKRKKEKAKRTKEIENLRNKKY
jgi:hypothetical protein